MITGIIFVFYANAGMETYFSKQQFTTMEECYESTQTTVDTVREQVGGDQNLQWACAEIHQ